MDNLDAFKNLWQSQEQELVSRDLPTNESDLAAQLKAFQKKTAKEDFSSPIVGIIVHAVLLSTFYFLHGWKYITGILMVLLAVNMMVALIKRSQLSTKEIDFNQQGTDFITNILRKIKARRKMTTRYMPIYALLLIGGINLSYLDILPLMDLTKVQLLLIHGGLTLMMGLAFYFGIKSYLKKFDDKVNPMVAELEAIEASWMV